MDYEQSAEEKRYQSPQLTVISLRPEEAVLGHCKTLNSGGQLGSSCNFMGFGQCANSAGS